MQLDPICIKYDEAVHIEGLAPAPHVYQRVETATIPRDVLRILPGRAQGRLHKDPGSPTRGWQDRGFRAGCKRCRDPKATRSFAIINGVELARQAANQVSSMENLPPSDC